MCVCVCVCVCGGGGGGGRVTYMSLVPSDVIPTDLTNMGRDQRDQSRNHHEHRAATGGAVPPTDQVSGLPTENAMFVCVCVCVVCCVCVRTVLKVGEGEGVGLCVCVCVGGGGGGVG